MSATTPAIQGGTSTKRLGAALVAVALAIVALIAMVGISANANRTATTAPAAAPAPASQHDRGWANDQGAAVNRTAPANQLGGYWEAISTGGSAAAPVALPRVFDPYHDDSISNGGRGTRMAR